MSERGADGDESPRRDPHPEMSAPILDLSLEAQIARAEQAVKDRDARVRVGASRIGAIVNAERGLLIKRAAIVGAMGLALGAGYAGYKALRKRKSAPEPTAERDPSRQEHKAFELADLAAFARTATQWGMRLNNEQGLAGSVFGLVRKALWPGHASFDGPPASPVDDGPPRESYFANVSEGGDALR